MPQPLQNIPIPGSYIVVGTSVGGLKALTEIFKRLPADLPAAVLVVQHIRKTATEPWLPRQLSSIGHIPVKLAEDGEAIRQGNAYVAPPGTHLLVRPNNGHVSLGIGPPEHYSRPAIDALFRSAASAFGRRVIGVILSGMQRDGALGLQAVAQVGGITVVQNPEGAEAPSMPSAALRNSSVDYCLELSEIGPLLDLLVRRIDCDDHIVLETGVASSIRMLKDRARLFGKLYAQSHGNPKTERFLQTEIAALKRDIAEVQSLLPE